MIISIQHPSFWARNFKVLLLFPKTSELFFKSKECTKYTDKESQAKKWRRGKELTQKKEKKKGKQEKTDGQDHLF